jgi:hypothetical protein
MVKLVILACALVVASAVQAKPVPLLQQQTDDVVVTVREGCGVGYQRVGGRCVRNTAVRAFRRCAAGYRVSGNRCIRRAPKV